MIDVLSADGHLLIIHSKWELASTAEGQTPEGVAAAPAVEGEAEDDLKGWQLVR